MLVHKGRARSNDHPGQTQLLDVLPDEVLSWVGAHVTIVSRYNYIIERGGEFRHLLHIYRACDVGAAVTDVNAYSFHNNLPLPYE
jgi:hypothetical protein